MSLKVGNTIPRRLYKGSNLVSRVYKGDALQWERLTREGRSFVSPADGEVSLDTIYGKSLVWNQLASNNAMTVQNCNSRTFDNGYTTLILTNGTAIVRMAAGYAQNGFHPGDKILVISHVKQYNVSNAPFNKLSVKTLWNITKSRIASSAVAYMRDGVVAAMHTIVSSVEPTDRIGFYFDVNNNSEFEHTTSDTIVASYNIFNLTKMFGVGNEPSTVEEFEALFPEPYYPYDEGSVIHLGGNPIVWNQLINEGVTVWTSGMGTLTYNESIITLTVTNAQNVIISYTKSQQDIIPTHKYCFKARAKISYDGRIVPTFLYSNQGVSFSAASNVWINLDCILTAQASSPVLRIYLIDSSVGDTMDITDIQLFDLTLMFGEGNEPTTVEEFEKLFPLPYYPYNSGTEMKASTIDIDVKGFNLWDEEWELGGLDYSSGQNDSTSNRLRSKNYIECIGGRQYYFYSGGSNAGAVCYYDSDKNFISSNTGVNRIITVPTNAAFLRFYIYKSGITTYANDICINVSNPTYNGQYKPYHQEKTVRIPLTTLTSNGEFIFTDGVCGIGTVCDEVGQSKVIKRIGSRPYTAGDEGDSSVMTDGAVTRYVLTSPIEYPLDIPFKVEYEIVEGGSESLVGLTAPIKEDIALNYN